MLSTHAEDHRAFFEAGEDYKAVTDRVNKELDVEVEQRRSSTPQNNRGAGSNRQGSRRAGRRTKQTPQSCSSVTGQVLVDELTTRSTAKGKESDQNKIEIDLQIPLHTNTSILKESTSASAACAGL